MVFNLAARNSPVTRNYNPAAFPAQGIYPINVLYADTESRSNVCNFMLTRE